MIDTILGNRPHRARSACIPGADAVSTFLRLLAMLIAERVPVDLSQLYGEETDAAPRREGRTIVVPVGGLPFAIPFSRERSASADPALAERSRLNEEIDRAVDTEAARGQAHAAFLRYSASLQTMVGANIAFQTTLLETMVAIGLPAFPRRCEEEKAQENRCLPSTAASVSNSPSDPLAVSSVRISLRSTGFRRASDCRTNR